MTDADRINDRETSLELPDGRRWRRKTGKARSIGSDRAKTSGRAAREVQPFDDNNTIKNRVTRKGRCSVERERVCMRVCEIELCNETRDEGG